jgi:hypothetical protein
MPLACTHPDAGDKGQSSHNLLFGMKEKRKSKRCIAQILPEYPAVLVQPLAAEQDLFLGLFGTTATEGTVCCKF